MKKVIMRRSFLYLIVFEIVDLALYSSVGVSGVLIAMIIGLPSSSELRGTCFSSINANAFLSNSNSIYYLVSSCLLGDEYIWSDFKSASARICQCNMF